MKVKHGAKERLFIRVTSAYSDLVVMKNGEIGMLFEKNEYSENVFLSFPFNWISN